MEGLWEYRGKFDRFIQHSNFGLVTTIIQYVAKSVTLGRSYFQETLHEPKIVALFAPLFTPNRLMDLL